MPSILEEVNEYIRSLDRTELLRLEKYILAELKKRLSVFLGLPREFLPEAQDRQKLPCLSLKVNNAFL